MAEQYTPEEIRAIFDEYNTAIKTGTPITADLAAKFKDAATGVKNYTDQLNKSLKSLGSSILNTAAALKDGKQGAAVFNDSIESFADAIDSFLSKFGFLGKMLGTLLTAGARYAIEVNKQSDALFDAYKKLSSSGLADAGGMRNIFDNMQKFGYGIEQLGEMTELLKANSKALASFGGTAASGTRAFADAATQIQRSDVGKSLQMLGKTPDEINKGMALFVKQQQQSGVSSANINKNLAQQSAAYIRNLDILSKLTGEDAAKLQEKLDAAMAEDAFNQTIYELKKKGAAGDAESARLATEYENAARRLTGEALKEFQRGVGSDISSMSKTMMVSSEAVMTIGTRAFTASGYIDKMAKGADRFREGMGGLYKLNALNDVAFSAKELSEIQSRYADDTAQQQESRAKAEQELQKKGLDPATKAQVELRIEQMKTRDEFQSLINKGINPVTKGMAKLASGIEAVTDKLPGSETSTGEKIGGGDSGGTSWWKRLLGIGPSSVSGMQYTGDMKKILDTIKGKESGGDYTIEHRPAKGQPKSSGSGAYGFLDSSWVAQAKKAGVGTEYKRAKDAPPEIQDQVAASLVNDILKQAGGDVTKIPIAWYTGNIQGKISQAAMDANLGMTPADYQAKWMASYNKQGGANNISGPNSGYQNKMNEVKPDKTLPSKDTPREDAAARNAGSSDDILTMFSAALEGLDRRMSDVVDNTKKTANNTQ